MTRPTVNCSGDRDNAMHHAGI